MEFQEKFKSIRHSLNLNQRDFAEKLGVSQGRISEIEKGSARPSFETLQALKENFNVSLDWIFSTDDSFSDNNIKLSDYEKKILTLLSQLPDREKYKLEGMLEYKVSELAEVKAKKDQKVYSSYTV